MLFRLAVAGVLCFSGAVSQETHEDSFVDEDENEDAEEVEHELDKAEEKETMGQGHKENRKYHEKKKGKEKEHVVEGDDAKDKSGDMAAFLNLPKNSSRRALGMITTGKPDLMLEAIAADAARKETSY